MNLIAILWLAAGLMGKTEHEASLIPYPPEVPKPPPATVERDEELQDLVDDLDAYRFRYYHGDLALRYGARMKVVRKVMGDPDIEGPLDDAGRRIWWYGKSFVVFRDRRAVAWEQNDTELAFGLEVAPRDYLPRTAFRDVGPPTGTLVPVLPGGAPPGGAPPEGALSVVDRARDAYLLALRRVSENPMDRALFQAAQQAGERYYQLLRPDGRLTPQDEAQISADIAAALRPGTPRQ